MGEFRDRILQDMQIRGLGSRTQEAYLACMRQFIRYFGRGPAEVTAEAIRRYQAYMTSERKVSSSYFNQAVSAIKFFYRVTLPRPWGSETIHPSFLPERTPPLTYLWRTLAIRL
jgi:site-specific recombinase XerD